MQYMEAMCQCYGIGVDGLKVAIRQDYPLVDQSVKDGVCPTPEAIISPHWEVQIGT